MALDLRFSPLILSMLMFTFGCNDSSVGRHNAAPDATITSHTDGDSVYEGYTVTLRGSASDADNVNTDLAVTWYVGSEEACSGAPEADGSTECEVAIEVGDEEIILEVKDIEGAAGTATVSLEILNTETPIVEITAPSSEGVYYSDQLVEFSGFVADEEEEAADLNVWWESSLGDDMTGVDVSVDSNGELSGFGTLSEGAHVIELSAGDLSGKVGSDSVMINVGPPNSPPLCEITAPVSNSTAVEGELVMFEAAVSDVDVPSSWLLVEWISDTDGPLGTSSATSAGEVAFPFGNLTVGTHVVTLSVTDEVGADCADLVVVTVGTAPSITIDSPSSGAIFSEGELISFIATISDSQDLASDLLVDWVSDLDGTISNQGPDSSGQALFVKNDLTTGSHVLTATVTDTDGLYSTAIVSFIVNGLPSEPTVTLSPDPATTADSIVATATGSVDPESTTVSYSYEWYNGGVLSSASTVATLPYSATSKDELWSVVVTPTDADGGVGTAGTATIMIDNTAPIMSTPVITPSTGITTSSTLVCSASATDADGETPTITYEWTNGTTTLGTSASLTLSSATSAPSDTITCSVIATDGSGDTDSGSASVSVDNSDPVVASVAISPQSGVTTSSTLSCSASATDADGGSPTLSYQWTNGSSTLGTSSSLTLTSSTASPSDSITCTVTATDSDGGTDSGYDTVSVDNSAPVVSNVSLSPSSGVTTNTPLTCSATAIDPDGGSPTIIYSWTNGSSTMGTGASVTLNSSIASPSDTITCTATATDSDGATDWGASSVSVENSTPTFSVGAMITPSSGVTTSSTLACSATASDIDGGTPTLSYVWSNSSSTIGSGSNITLSSSTASPSDTITCTVMATDSDGASVVSTDSVSVDNTDPAVSSVSISPSSGVTVTSTLTCSATATDADGGSPTISYEWMNGSSTLGTSSSLTLSASTASSGDTITCTATATDADGGTDTDTATATVTNSAPVLTSVALTPTSATETSTLTCTPSGGTDADGDTVSYSYAWNINGIASSQMTATIDGTYFNRDEAVYCVVTPNDGSTTGTPVTSNSVTIANTAPSASSLSITPSPALDNDTLSCSYSFSDTDGDSDSSTIAWTVGSASIGTGSTVSSGFVAGDTVTCTVTPNDGADTGTPVATSTSIGSSNTAPVVTAVTLSPSTIYTDDTLSASVTASDVDGDAITYTFAWYVNSSLVAETSSAINCTTYCDKGQTVYVSVTPSDGTDSGSAVASSTVTVLNTTPTAPVVSLDPASPYSGVDDIICLINTASNDDDGDTITYTFDWTVNGTVWSGSTYSTYETGDTISGTDTSGGDVWQCTVTPNDGSTDGPSVSDNVTVMSSSDGQARMTNGTWIDVQYEVCGSSGNCTASAAKAACSAVGLRVVSHASNGTSDVISLGATSSCYWSVSYYTAYSSMPSGSCLVGVSNLEWSSCCGTSSWHGNTIEFQTSPSVFGYVSGNDSGYTSSYSNLQGTRWGCQGEGSAAPTVGSCSTHYVACAQ
jgi:hypothetical protein